MDYIFSDSFKKYGPVLTIFKEEFKFEAKLQNFNKDSPFLDALLIFLEFFMNSLRVKEMRYFYLSLFKDFVNNYRDLLDRTPLIDKKLYTQMKRFIDRVNEKDSEKTHQVIESSIQIFNPISKVRSSTRNILIVLPRLWDKNYEIRTFFMIFFNFILNPYLTAIFIHDPLNKGQSYAHSPRMFISFEEPFK